MIESELLAKLDYWSRFIETNPKQARGWYERGGIWLDLNRYEEALGDYTTALRIDPGFTNCRYCRALALEYLGREDDAFEDYAQVIEDDPRHVSAYNNRGGILFHRGELREAFSDFLTASKIDPTHPRSRYNQGLVLGSLGRYQEAIAAFTSAIDLNSAYTKAYMMRAKAYVYVEAFDLAEDDLRRAAALGSDPATWHSMRARSFLLRGLFDECSEEVRRAGEINSECEELKLVAEEILALVSDFKQRNEPGQEPAVSRYYSPEEEYRELMRPSSEKDKISEMLCAFLLAENIEALARAVLQYPYLLNELNLRYLEAIGKKNLPLRAMIRWKVDALQSMRTQVQNAAP